MFARFSPHTRAVLQALFVTFLWSTSWVLIKLGMRDEQLPALTFAGLRYTLAFCFLLPLLLKQPAKRAELRRLNRKDWLRLIILGILFYAVTQGAQFIGLGALPAISVNLLLSLTTLAVTALGIWMLGERPTGLQWGGTALYIAGVAVFFYPAALPADQLTVMLVVLGGVLANAASSVLGRAINRKGDLSPLTITVVSMGTGSVILLVTGLLLQGFPALSLRGWLIILWLAAVNTAFAFTLWNHTLRTLSAMESSIINNMMMVQIPLLAWLFLGEGITLKSGIGFALAGIGILIVQLRQLPQRKQAQAVTIEA